MNRLSLGLSIAFLALLEGCSSTLQAKPEHRSDFFNDKARLGVAAETVVPHVHAQTKTDWSERLQLLSTQGVSQLALLK